jgi:hypothetical protein
MKKKVLELLSLLWMQKIEGYLFFIATATVTAVYEAYVRSVITVTYCATSNRTLWLP